MTTQDTWFLLLISAIWTELRLVGIAGFRTVKKAVLNSCKTTDEFDYLKLK
jgi:hypothetical protein